NHARSADRCNTQTPMIDVNSNSKTSPVVVKQRIVIIGAAESGVGAAVLAAKKGFDVFVSDNGRIKDEYKRVLNNYSISFEEGIHNEMNIMNANEIIKSPGV